MSQSTEVIQSGSSGADQNQSSDEHFTHSSLREKIVEHAFVGDLLRACWRKGIFDIEVLKSEFDAHGYDVVFVRGQIARFVQLKTNLRRPASLSISEHLASRVGACVIWIHIDEKLSFRSFEIYEGVERGTLDFQGLKPARRIGRDSKGTRPQRKNHKTVPLSKFRRLSSIDEVLDALIGSASA